MKSVFDKKNFNKFLDNLRIFSYLTKSSHYYEYLVNDYLIYGLVLKKLENPTFSIRIFTFTIYIYIYI